MNKDWYKEAIVYQIYPKSFYDSNNDGIGDILGIISKLDYLKELGVTQIWLSPIYVSPMEDNGYDVEDYYNISPLYGTLEDFDKLISEAKKRDIGILMDLVFNHTSTKHIWFQNAINDPSSKYHDYYFFRKNKDDKRSIFSGSAWEYVEKNDEYYYHAFGVNQADLNWKNQDVRDEIVNIMEFYLKRGVSGFRLDAIELIGKDLENNIFAHGDSLHAYLREVMTKVRTKYPYMMTVGEGWPTPEIAKLYASEERNEINMIFQFETPTLTWQDGPLGKFSKVPFTLEKLKESFGKWQKLTTEVWCPVFWENHDLTRSINRFGSLDYKEDSAKALATLLLISKGTPFIYQGEELGLTDVCFEKLSDIKDIEAKMIYEEFVLKKKTMDEHSLLKLLNVGVRDQGRLLMPWDDTKNGGFSSSDDTWIMPYPNYKTENVMIEKSVKSSVLNCYKELISLRKNQLRQILRDGIYQELPYKNLFAYKIESNTETVEVLINFSVEYLKENINLLNKKVLFQSKNKLIKDNYQFDPYEVIILQEVKNEKN